MDTLSITPDTPDAPDVRAVLMCHFDLMRAGSPEESCHVMDPSGLKARGVTLLAARAGATLLGVGALAPLEAAHGELKSMHTLQQARGRGVGRALVHALVEQARARGMARVSLETGSAALFAPARALYTACGFERCAPFGDYIDDPLSVFMTRTL